MKERPLYFEPIRERAAQRWIQLEQDPELAAPWHLLFKQVQSPRHVLSELLQNADDAGATEASVHIDAGEFVFSHNGQDFIEEHFASLCRFGYSNKRALHTIGFRGVGFKSTFCLGDEVRLYTPTLSVAFHRRRFTEPVWIERSGSLPPHTEVRVSIKDERHKDELKKNLEEWLQNSVSLLFFRSIRCLRIGNQEIQWISIEPGPVENSEWVALSTNPEEKYLLLRSVAEEFPSDSIDEIRQERMLSDEESFSFPPCHVEIILNMEGHLFVILPTEIKTELPFACNAPFVQDPGRSKIKDPGISPTNRWLLRRAGKLAANGMLGWLRRQDLEIEDRCEAYALFPDVNRHDESLEGRCATIVEEAFEDGIKGVPFLLTEDGTLVAEEKCIWIPPEILGIWSPHQVTELFDKDNRSVVNRNISEAYRRKLINWNCFEELTKTDFLDVLESKHLPRPDTWRQLLALWVFVSPEVVGYHYSDNRKGVRIIPVRGKDVLYSSKNVVRLGEKKLLQSDDDWEFLSEHLLVVNPNWLRFLTKQRRKAEKRKDDVLGQQVEKASAVLKAFKLGESSDVSGVIKQVAEEIFSQDECTLEVCVRLAQIAAKLGASVGKTFEFIVRDNCRKSISQHVVADISGDLEQFTTSEWYEEHVLHDKYSREFVSCTEIEWRQWITSGRSGLLTFVPLIPIWHSVSSREQVRRLLHERGYRKNPDFEYKEYIFTINDWDFDEAFWKVWSTIADRNESFWAKLFGKVLSQPKAYWAEALSAEVDEIARNGWERKLHLEGLPSSWIAKFRSLPCLQDTRGTYCRPAELLLRAPETEPLLDVEPFVRSEHDNEHTRPLLIRLGVRDTPTGPDRLLERLRALATSDDPPVKEVKKWYDRLDKLVNKCTTEEFGEIKDAFAKEKIILIENNNWARSDEVFLSADEEEVPGAASVHSSVRHLSLWRKIGVGDQPTPDLAIRWLKELDSDNRLSQDELRRVRLLLPKYPERIWSECGHWLNLEDRWTPVDQLSYSLTMQSLVPWKHLFRQIKQKTADFQKLPSEISQKYPFSKLKSLSESIEDRFQEAPYGLPAPQKKPWMATLGSALQRILLEDESETNRVRELAGRLAITGWQIASELKTTPYIDGTPAGTSRSVDALWKDSILFVEDRSIAKMAKSVARELGRVFNKEEITEAIKLCYERSPEFVMEYLEENFTLLREEKTDQTGTQPNSEAEKKDQPVDDKMPTANTTTGEKPIRTELGAGKLRGEHDGSTPDTQGENVTFKDELANGGVGKDEKGGPDKRPPKHPKTPKPSLIERFALAMGYEKVRSDQFCHQDGSRIQKASESSFPWQRYSPAGELMQCYWAKDHCIERGPLQVDADVWELCTEDPDKYTLLLTNLIGDPVEFSGHLLLELQDSGRLTLYPAKYRLEYDLDKEVNIHG